MLLFGLICRFASIAPCPSLWHCKIVERWLMSYTTGKPRTKQYNRWVTWGIFQTDCKQGGWEKIPQLNFSLPFTSFGIFVSWPRWLVYWRIMPESETGLSEKWTEAEKLEDNLSAIVQYTKGCCVSLFIYLFVNLFIYLVMHLLIFFVAVPGKFPGSRF